MNYPLVSVIVLNYNGRQYLPNLFDSLRKTDFPSEKMEIIMGDNASTDDSVAFVKTKFPEIRVFEFKKNYGFCEGNNLCVENSRGQYVMFLNNDTLVTPDWLKNLANAVLEDKTVVAAGSKLLKPYSQNGKKIIDYAGGKITCELNFYEGLYDFDGKNYSVQKYTGFGCGAAVIVNKQFFRSIGGFDEYYFGGGEEVEVGLRAWQYGFKVLYVPSSVIYHFRGCTFKSINNRATYEWVKSTLYFILKNYESKLLVIYLTENLLLTYFPKLVVFLLQGNVAALKIMCKGLLDFFTDLKKKNLLGHIYQERLRIRNRKKFTDSELAGFGIMTSFGERMRYRIKSYQGWKAKY